MQRLICTFITIILLIISTTEVAAAEISFVKAKGEGANEMQAKEACLKDAVAKALVYYIPNSNDPNGVFQQIVNQYPVLTGKLEIIQTGKIGSGFCVIGKVETNISKIEESVNHLIKTSSAADKVACMLIRVQGVGDTSKIGRYQQRIRETFGDTFQNLGFKTKVIDELNADLNKLNTASYEVFCETILAKIKQDYPEVTFAVIGEIILSSSNESATEYIRDGIIKVHAIDLIKNTPPIIFNDSQRKSHSDLDNVDLLTIEKCSLSAAKKLAGEMLAK